MQWLSPSGSKYYWRIIRKVCGSIYHVFDLKNKVKNKQKAHKTNCQLTLIDISGKKRSNSRKYINLALR
jgi:hypothetical protein